MSNRFTKPLIPEAARLDYFPIFGRALSINYFIRSSLVDYLFLKKRLNQKHEIINTHNFVQHKEEIIHMLHT